MIHYMTTQGIGNAWVANELRIVTRAGIPVRLHALRGSGRRLFSSEWAADMDRSTRVLYPIRPLAMVVSLLLAPMLFGVRFLTAMANALFGQRENNRTRVASLGHLLAAIHWARGLRRDPVTHIHSQWIHSGGTVAMYGAWLLGVPFSFTGHATDLFRDRCALRDKIRRARFIICISEFHRRFFLEQGARPEQLHVAYCGIDVDRMAPRNTPRRDGPFHILSTGRLVEKKGFEHLIDACAILTRRGRDFRCTIGGSGELRESLEERIRLQGLSDRVRVTGEELRQEDIPAFMHTGDAYVLACVWARDGDVDGLPKMTMEAMACGLPAVTTRLVGNPDLVIHEQTGLLVSPGNAEELADAIQRLMDDPVLAERLAKAGREWIRERFDIERCLEPLISQFRRVLADASQEAIPAATAGAGAEGTS